MGLVRRSNESRLEAQAGSWEDDEKPTSHQLSLNRLRRQITQSRGWLTNFVLGFAAAWLLLSLASWSGAVSSSRSATSFSTHQGPIIARRRSKDGLQGYIKDEHCNFSANDIHHPFSPLCTDRASLLDAMSGGGRTGWDKPYWSRDCDMQWFNVAQICQILSRFDHVYVVGDSLMRNLNMALIMLLRGDLSRGARAEWLDTSGAEDACTCRSPFNDHTCLPKYVYDTQTLLAGSPGGVACPADKPMAHVTWHSVLSFPVDERSFAWMENITNTATPNGRTVFVLEHGFWNDLDVPSSMAWFEQVNDAIERYMPAYARADVDQRLFPRLYITPQAQGELKPSQFVGTQNNQRLQVLTREMRSYVLERGYEHLGLFNATVQATSTDGTHTTLETNLLKAMMLLNWLNMIDAPEPEVVQAGPAPPTLAEMVRALQT